VLTIEADAKRFRPAWKRSGGFEVRSLESFVRKTSGQAEADRAGLKGSQNPRSSGLDRRSASDEENVAA